MKKISCFSFILFLVLFIGSSLNSYSQNWEWAVSCAKGTDDDDGSIAIDASDNLYLTGTYTHPRGIFGDDTLVPAALGGYILPIMFSKINGSGVFQWTTGIKTNYHVFCDENNYYSTVLANKNFNGAWFYGGACGDLHFDSVHFYCNINQVFLTRYDENGKCLWAKLAQGNGGSSAANACLDSYGNTYITGFTFGPTQFEQFTIGTGQFLAKYNQNGACLWVKIIGDSNFQFLSQGISADEDQIIILFKTESQTPVNISGLFVDPSQTNILMASYDSSGTIQWAKTLATGRGFSCKLSGFEFNHRFNVIGQCNNIIFGNDTLINTSEAPQMFITKFDSLGNSIWARITSGGNHVYSGGVVISHDSAISITGHLSVFSTNKTTYFGEVSATIPAGTYNIETFITQYNSQGNCTGVIHVPSEVSQLSHPGQLSVVPGPNGSSIVAGQFTNSPSFGSFTLNSGGAYDIFIAKCDALTGIEQAQKKPNTQLLIYANPNLGKCTVIIPDELKNEKNLTLSVLDSQGKTIQKTRVEVIENRISLNIAAEASGVYNVILTDGKQVYTGKIVFK